MIRAPGGLLALALSLAAAAQVGTSAALPKEGTRAAGAARPATEAPPAQGTRLHFQKTLSIVPAAQGRIFLETRRIERASRLAEVLLGEYGVSPEALPALTAAFRSLNPGADPDRLAPGQTLRVPFKVEESPRVASAAPRAAPAPAPSSYTVRQGDSLWRILKRRYKVTKDGMGQALRAVARANPTLKDLNHLVAGQTLTIPSTVAAGAPPAPAAPLAASSPSPPGALPAPVLALLEQLSCRVVTRGETFLPLGRGRTVRLDAREFPLVTGPSGRSVVLDPATRMSPALTRGVEDAWGYTVLQGRETDVEALLGKILPHLGFHEAVEGPRASPILPGVELRAQTRWSVVPRAEDLWEGQVHLLFPPKAALDPAAAALALRSGYSLHSLGGADPGPAAPPPPVPDAVPEIPWNASTPPDAAILAAFGVPHRVRPDVECDLGGGVRYHLRPEVTFEQAGTAYAVPPREPQRAEALLARAGYFTVPLPASSDPYARAADLLALLGRPSKKITVEAPEGGALRIRLEGLAFEDEAAARRLYPAAAHGRASAAAKILLTRALVSPEAARVLLGAGYLPWVLRPLEPAPPGSRR